MTAPDPSDAASFATMMALEAHGPDTFVGVGPEYPWGGLYGGQIVAQSLRAAGLTVEPHYLPHSLHGYFIRRGDASEPIRFEVDRIRNGRSFVTRRVVARQSVGAIFNLSSSFQVAEDSHDVESLTVPVEAGAPDDATDDTWSHVFDRRHVISANERMGRALCWMRMRESVPADPLLQACAIAYESDDLPTEASLAEHPDRLPVPEGEAEDDDGGFMAASLDHSIWFHRPIDPATWHVYDFRGQGFVGSRGLAIGQVFGADGRHAATVSQEMLIRVRR